MSLVTERQLIRTVGAAFVTALVADLLRHAVNPAVLVVISPIVMLMAHQLLDDLASQLPGSMVGVTA